MATCPTCNVELVDNTCPECGYEAPLDNATPEGEKPMDGDAMDAE
ncbi:MAG TPA: hypothetical protein PLK76_04125 [bacterium]|nr:hypothetical protein [bacterium]